MTDTKTIAKEQPVREPGVVAAGVYTEGCRVQEIEIDDAGEWAAQPGHFVWIGLLEPSEALLARIQAIFKLPALAIEDAAKAHQRPKMEQYGDMLFIVARTAQMVEGRVAFGETHLFVGRGFVISIRHGASTSYATVRERCEGVPNWLAHGEDYVLYAILDFIVDNYSPVVETVQAEVEAIEDKVLASRLVKGEVERLYLLRRDLQRLRGAVLPLVEVCRRLEQVDVPVLDAGMQPLFRDVSDHIRRVQDEIDTLREVLAFAFEASMMIGQEEQTATTRRLAAWAAILAVPTAIAGIYGMNFEYMPELKWGYGYFLVLGVIVATCVGLFIRFRQLHWL